MLTVDFMIHDPVPPSLYHYQTNDMSLHIYSPAVRPWSNALTILFLVYSLDTSHYVMPTSNEMLQNECVMY